MGIFSKFSDGLKKTRESMSEKFDSVFSAFKKVDEELFEELEEALITSDVGVTTTEQIIETLREKVKSEHIHEVEPLKAAISEIVSDMLAGGEQLQCNTKPTVILMIGVNGAGKTTTIGKLALRFKSEGKKVILGAADTFRAAAIEQLEVWADRAGVDIVKHAEGADPAAVVYDTISAGKARGADVIICDTAGRLHNKKNLMDELGKIARIVNRELPDSDKETLLVLDATTGQNGLNQAREFQQCAGITGIVLTKLDGTARGGVVIAIRNELDLPVKFIGVGEGIDDLQPFDSEAFATALFSDVSAQEETPSEVTQEIVEEAETELEVETEVETQAEPEVETQVEETEPEEEPQPETEEDTGVKFVLASQNKKKMVEMQRILEPMGISLYTAAELGFTEDIVEDGSTFQENSLIKAQTVCDALGIPAIADDSGLCVDYLDGAPGIYSARFAGDGHDDEANNDKLLELLDGVKHRKRKAKYVCAISVVFPDGRKLAVEGECKGYIGTERKGTAGFGYDPLFLVGKGDRTFGEYSDEEKDAVSHRGNALRKLQKHLPKYLEV